MNELPQIKHPIRLAVLCIIGVVLLTSLIYLFSHGAVSLKTNDGSSTVILDKNNKSVESTAKTTLFKILPTGSYVVSTTKDQGVVRKRIEVSAFHITELTLEPSAPKQAQPVTNYSAFKPYDHGGVFTFIDRDSNSLSQVTADNNFKLLLPGYSVYDIAWRGEKALLQTGSGDGSNQLFAFENNSPRLLTLPNNSTSASSISIKSGANGFYATIDDTLYWLGDDMQKFQKVADTGSVSILSASGSQIAVGSYSADDSLDLSVYSVANNSKLQTKTFTNDVTPYSSFAANYSPDGSKLLITSTSQSGVYNTDLSLIQQFPDNTVNAAAWLDNDNILYVSKNILWKYNINDRLSSSIGSMPTYATVYGLTTSNSTAYIQTDSSGFSSLYKVDLSKDQAVNDNATILGESNMQTLDTGCVIHYVNYSSLFLTLSAPEDSLEACKSSAETYLDSIGLPDNIPLQPVKATSPAEDD